MIEDRVQQPTTLRRHPLSVVAQRTGLEESRIIDWRDLGALDRSSELSAGDGAAGERFSDADIDRLLMLRKLEQLGHDVARLATYDSDQLERLVAVSEGAGTVSHFLAFEGRRGEPERPVPELLWEAAQDLNTGLFTSLLRRSAMSLDRPAFLSSVMGPFLNRIRQARNTSRWRPIHECLTEASLRRVLGEVSVPVAPEGPAVWLAAPRGQKAGVEGLLACEWLRAGGWRPVWLGAQLSAFRLLEALNDEPGALVLVVDDAEALPAPTQVIGEVASSSRLGDRLVLWGGAVEGLRTDLPAATELEALDLLLTRNGTPAPTLEDVRRGSFRGVAGGTQPKLQGERSHE